MSVRRILLASGIDRAARIVNREVELPGAQVMWRSRRPVKMGDTVRIHYTGTLEDGTVCLGSTGRGPLRFAVGRRRLIAGIEEAVIGMCIGEMRTFTVQPRDAFGEHHDGMLITVDRRRVHNGLAPEIGQRVWATCASGRKMSVTVVEVSRTKVTLDTNHPLAGKAITFEIHLVGIG